MPSHPFKYQTLTIAVKMYAKVEIEVSSPIQYYWISLLYFKYFVRDCRETIIFCDNFTFIRVRMNVKGRHLLYFGP